MANELSVKKAPSSKALINKMLEAEVAIGKLPSAKFGDDCCPLIHHFADRLYARKMTAPKGMLNISKLHKTTHFYFILEGDVSVLTENGIVRIKAPHTGITKAGTKRIVFFHAETVWITVHPNPDNKTDLAKIEERLIANSYDELPESVKQGKLL